VKPRTDAPRQVPLMVPRCAQDVVGTIGPLVMGDGRGPWFWTLPDGRGGWADSVEGAWEGMERARRG
jgi:hypothetical protein